MTVSLDDTFMVDLNGRRNLDVISQDDTRFLAFKRRNQLVVVGNDIAVHGCKREVRHHTLGRRLIDDVIVELPPDEIVVRRLAVKAGDLPQGRIEVHVLRCLSPLVNKRHLVRMVGIYGIEVRVVGQTGQVGHFISIGILPVAEGIALRMRRVVRECKLLGPALNRSKQRILREEVHLNDMLAEGDHRRPGRLPIGRIGDIAIGYDPCAVTVQATITVVSCRKGSGVDDAGPAVIDAIVRRSKLTAIDGARLRIVDSITGGRIKRAGIDGASSAVIDATVVSGEFARIDNA